jgi:hypothetical protein
MFDSPSGHVLPYYSSAFPKLEDHMSYQRPAIERRIPLKALLGVLPKS